jgi:hypothetical protein
VLDPRESYRVVRYDGCFAAQLYRDTKQRAAVTRVLAKGGEMRMTIYFSQWRNARADGLLPSPGNGRLVDAADTHTSWSITGRVFST